MVTPTRRPSASQPESKGWVVAGWLLAIVVVIALLGKCGSSTGGYANNMSTDNTLDTMTMSEPVAPAPPPEPLNAASVTRGITHLRTAFAAEGFSGAMIYSQNCYDALGHQFAWSRLDQCGAADTLAARSLADADTAGLDNEIAYFQSETAAGRYLAAATGAGENAAEADRRLSQLQARLARSRTVGRRPPPPPDDEAIDAETDEGGPADNATSGDQSAAADSSPTPTAGGLDQDWLDRAISGSRSSASGK